jgi:hypothetical protein
MIIIPMRDSRSNFFFAKWGGELTLGSLIVDYQQTNFLMLGKGRIDILEIFCIYWYES